MTLVRTINIHIKKLIANNSRIFCTSLKNTESDFIHTKEINGKGIIVINRANALNAVNVEMVEKISDTLRKWKTSKSMVIIKGAGGKAFSVGGDLKSVVNCHSAMDRRRLFEIEYNTVYLVKNYSIPLVALIDGFTMGGGAGLAVHGKYVVATERTIFAMPETAIGLIPDSSSSYFLSRQKNNFGLYLGLTGGRLKGKDVLRAGIATHYCESSSLNKLEETLLSAKDSKPDEMDAIFRKYCVPYKPDEIYQIKHLDQINKCFNASTLEKIFENLRNDGSDWAKDTLRTLQRMSPTSLKIAFKLFALAAEMSLADCLKFEYRINARLLKEHDFNEGIRALLIDKDNTPKWIPDSIEQISEERVSSFLEPLPINEELQL